MNRPIRAGDSAIALEVEEENLIFGVAVEKVQNNHYVMAHTKEPNLNQ